MARLWSCGFELNSITSGVEMSFSNGSGFSISSTTKRTGSYALEVKQTSAAATDIDYQYTANGGVNSAIFIRFYFYIQTLPNTKNEIIGIRDNTGVEIIMIRCQTGGALELWDGVHSVQVGSASSALSTGTWYRIELKIDNTTNTATLLDARIDGSSFASGTVNLGKTQQIADFGSPITISTFDYFYDDIAINDSTGSFQNSYPGAGSIIYLLSNASGDSTQWTPDAGSNYARVNEITPDDVTSYVQDVTLNNSDFYNVDNLLSVHQSISLVQVGVRFANDVADATTAFKVQAKKVTSGTISQSAAIIANSTTYKTNASAIPAIYPLTLHQDPDNINWIQDTINSLQIGVQTTAAGTNKNRVSTLWALVEYVPQSETNRFENQYRYGRVGDGMSRSEAWT